MQGDVLVRQDVNYYRSDNLRARRRLGTAVWTVEARLIQAMEADGTPCPDRYRHEPGGRWMVIGEFSNLRQVETAGRRLREGEVATVPHDVGAGGTRLSFRKPRVNKAVRG